jgi:GH18 family chitinase
MKTRLLFIFILISLSWNSFGQKIAGYLPSYRNPSPTLIQYSKLTHVLFSFVNPNSSGVLIGINTPNIGNANYDFDMNNFMIAKANCYPMVPNGPKLVISVGGADGGNVRATNLNTVCGNATARATLVSQLVSFALTHNLDGIDIDWEFPTSTTAKNNHQSLLADLRAAINASVNPNIRIGVAIGGETLGGTNHMQYINAAALTYVDDFNLMAYDLPNNGSYNATNHAALADMATLITNWNNFGVPKSKMVLGVPFYGRTSGRSATNGEWNVFTASYSAAQLTTALGSDGPSVTGAFYYNGRPTLEAKVDLIITTHCGQGIMIWDVGQDRTDAYSLLNVIYNRINTTTCSMATPNLGADINLCGANTTLTATGTPAASGRTFDWKRNGVLVTNTTANTYAATQGGTWTVTAKEGCCKKTDEVIITQGATVTATGATRCGTGTLNLNVTSTGSTYDWYNANANGTYLNTGATFTTPSISTTTTYYVQQKAGSRTYYTAKAYPGTSPQKEYADYSGRAHWANKMIVSQTLTIKSVDIYYSGPAVSNARLVAYNAGDGLSVDYQSTPVSLVAQTTPALGPGFHYTLSANLTLPPGTYYMAIYAPGADAQGANPGVALDPNGIGTPYAQAGLFSIEGQACVNWGGGFNAAAAGTNYGQLFNWVITAENNPCGRTAVVATINCPPTITLTSPVPPGPVTHNSGTALTLTATASDDGSVTGVSYEIRDAANTLITTVTGGAGPTYAASWTPPSTIQYKVRAVATDNTSLTNSTSDVIVDVILPVTLLYFDAQKENEDVLLAWATTTELNNDKFVIERSADGIQFLPIGSIAGQGNSTAIVGYSFTDSNPLSGTSYYRLAQYDYDGARENSQIKSVEFTKGISFTIAPNPFGEATILKSSSGTYTLKILSLQGTLIEERKCNGNGSVLEVGQDLKPGFYLLILSTDENTVTHKIEKLY